MLQWLSTGNPHREFVKMIRPPNRRSYHSSQPIDLLADRFPSAWSASLRDATLRRLLPSDRHDIHLRSALDIGLRNRHLLRLLICEPLAFIIPEHDLVLAYALDVLRQQRNLPTTTWGVDHELGHCQP